MPPRRPPSTKISAPFAGSDAWLSPPAAPNAVASIDANHAVISLTPSQHVKHRHSLTNETARKVHRSAHDLRGADVPTAARCAQPVCLSPSDRLRAPSSSAFSRAVVSSACILSASASLAFASAANARASTLHTVSSSLCKPTRQHALRKSLKRISFWADVLPARATISEHSRNIKRSGRRLITCMSYISCVESAVARAISPLDDSSASLEPGPHGGVRRRKQAKPSAIMHSTRQHTLLEEEVAASFPTEKEQTTLKTQNAVAGRACETYPYTVKRALNFHVPRTAQDQKQRNVDQRQSTSRRPRIRPLGGDAPKTCV